MLFGSATPLSLPPLLLPIELKPKPLQIRLVKLTSGVNTTSFTTSFFGLASRFLLLFPRVVRDDDDGRGIYANTILPDDKPTLTFELDSQ